MKESKILVVCPHCGAGGRGPGMYGQPMVCPDCGQEFRATRPGFWARQKLQSPIMQVWWLLPAVVVFVLCYLGAVSMKMVVVGVVIGLLAWIGVSLARMAKRADG